MTKKSFSKLALILMLGTMGFSSLKISAQELKIWTEIKENQNKIFIKNYNFENKGYTTLYQEFKSSKGNNLKNILNLKCPDGIKIKIWDYDSDSIIDSCLVTDKNGVVIGHYFKDKNKMAMDIAQKGYKRSMKKIKELSRAIKE